MADVTLNIRHNANQATPAVNSLSNAMAGLASNSKKAATSGTAAANGFKKIGQACLSAGKSATRGASGLSKFTSSLGRIAFYRAIRSAIRYVTDSFKQGLDAAYNWSKAQGGENAKLAAAMDALSTASGRMKLQLGAAFGGLIVAIEPILIRIINLVTAAADALTRFFAVLNGSGYYKKASSGLEKVGESAGGAGKQIKGLLASWDELNVIGKESGGGGGGGSQTGYTGDYEWVEAESPLADLFNEGLFFQVGQKINEALGGISQKITEWADNLKNLHIGQKIASFLNGIFANQESFYSAGNSLASVINTIIDIGLEAFSTFDWIAAGQSLASAIDGLIENIDWTGAAEMIGDGIWGIIEGGIEFFKNINWFALARGVADLVLGAINNILSDPRRLLIALKNLVVTLIDVVGGLIIGGLGGLLETIHPSLGKLIDGVEEDWHGFVNNIDQSWETGINKIADALGLPEKKTKDFEKSAEDSFKKVKQSADGAKTAIESVGKKTSGVETKVKAAGNAGKTAFDKTKTSAKSATSSIKEADKALSVIKSKTVNMKIKTAGVDDANKKINGVAKSRSVTITPKVGPVKQYNSDVKSKVTNVRSVSVSPALNSKDLPTFNASISKSVTNDRFVSISPKVAHIEEYNEDVKTKATNARSVAVKPYLTTNTLPIKASLENASALTEQVKSAMRTKVQVTVQGGGPPGTMYLAAKANGGFVESGQIFLANEAGPELVGTIGNSTAVANNDQIVAGIQNGVAQANAEQNELLRQQNGILMKLLNKQLTITPSVALGQVVARSNTLYARA